MQNPVKGQKFDAALPASGDIGLVEHLGVEQESNHGYIRLRLLEETPSFKSGAEFLLSPTELSEAVSIAISLTEGDVVPEGDDRDGV